MEINLGLKCALVTGSSSGIGRAVVDKLLSDGLIVFGWDKVKSGRADNNFIESIVDLLDDEQIDIALNSLEKNAQIDAVIHCAGWMKTATLENVDLSNSDDMWRVQVRSITQMVKTLLPAMRKAGKGRIILIGSRVANGKAGRSQYAAVKASLIALARSWAAEVISNGVTVNVVSPAATNTGMLSDTSRETQAPKLPPIGRFIDASEVASLVAYLLSPQAAAITGQNFMICGGSSLDI